MKIFWTRNWGLQPQPHYLFHIGGHIYLCRYRFWHIAIVEYQQPIGGH